MNWVRGLFLAVVVICAVWLSVLSIFVLDQTAATCHATNRSLNSQRASWDFLEQTVKKGWVKHPPTRTQRRDANDFFTGVKAPLKPAQC